MAEIEKKLLCRAAINGIVVRAAGHDLTDEDFESIRYLFGEYEYAVIVENHKKENADADH